MQRFGRRIKDQQFLWLLSVIISEQPGNGLPLGAYTSGWFANFYLDPIDHFSETGNQGRASVQIC